MLSSILRMQCHQDPARYHSYRPMGLLHEFECIVDPQRMEVDSRR